MVETESRQDGFTLLEVLIALTVLSLMFAGIFGFLGQLGNINRISQNSSDTNELEFLERHIRNSLSNSQRLPILSEGFLKQHYLVGTSSEVTFVGKSRLGVNGTGLFDITLRHDERENTLIEERRLRRFKDDGRNQIQRFVLFEDVETVSISYLRALTESGSEWESAWRAERKLPARLKFVMQFGDEHSEKNRQHEIQYNF